jgi:hypothetical protein
MSDFIPNKLGFNAAGCSTAILRAADALMQETVDIMLIIMKKEIDKNGNGSSDMKADAKTMVREILHEVAEDHISVDAGFDEAMANSMARDFYVRVMVVLHGNQAGGVLYSKPGASTFKKHVRGYGPSTAKSVYKLPDGFNQLDASDGILNNTMKEIEKYFEVMIAKLATMLTGDFFGQFITGG